MTRENDFYLDRIEGEVAVLIGEGMQLEIPRSLLPGGAREGDYLTLAITRDPERRRRITEEIEELRRRLDKGEDL